MRPITISPFLKGLQAANQILAQPKGSVARISNFCYKKRGAMSTVDGSLVINWYLGAIQSARGAAESVALFQPQGVARYFLELAEAPDQQLTVPVGLAAADGGAGGTLGAGTYYYKVTALDGAGGETPASSEVSITVSANHLVNLTWTPVTNAVSYNVYRGTSPSGEALLVGPGLPSFSASYTDNGSAAIAGSSTYPLIASPGGAYRNSLGGLERYQFNSSDILPNLVGLPFTITGSSPSVFNQSYVVDSQIGSSLISFKSGGIPTPTSGGGGFITINGGTPISPPSVNTTSLMALYKMPNVGLYPISYSASNIVATFPPAPSPLIGGEPAGSGGSGTTGGGGVVGGAGPSPNGGVVGGTSTLPLMVQFVNQMVLALGNGFAPQLFTDPDTIAAITNTFVPAFPAWQTATPFALNSIIVPANTQWGPNVPYPSQSAVVPDAGNGFYYVASKGGTSGGTEPSFPTSIGSTVTDGTVTWTCAGSSLYYYTAIQGGISQGPTGGSSIGTVPQFPQTVGDTVTDGSVVWKNSGLLTAAAPAPPGAAHAVVYAGSLWVGNTYPTDHPNGIDGPCAIRMSDTDAPNSWNPINQAFLDKDDGTEIQGFATFTITAQGIPPEGSLVVFKDFSTFQIVGVFGASNFAIQRVVTDMGCTAPRSIQFCPGFGIARLTHLGIAIFDGTRDKVISEEIRPYLFPSNDSDVSDITPMDQNYSYASYGFQTANPPMYCLAIPVGASGGKLTRILCYDLVEKVWGIVDLPFAISAASQVRAQGTIPIAMLGGFLDGALQRWEAGDIQWYTGASSPNQQNVQWSYRTQEMASQVADQRMYFRRLAIRGQNTNSTTGITVVPVVNGVRGNPYTSPPLPLGDFEIFAPIAMTGVRAHADVSGSGDVEIQGMSFHTEIKPAGVPVFIS